MIKGTGPKRICMRKKVRMITITDDLLKIWMTKSYGPQGVWIVTIRSKPLRKWMIKKV